MRRLPRPAGTNKPPIYRYAIRRILGAGGDVALLTGRIVYVNPSAGANIRDRALARLST
jgi:hypothetical protein